MSSVEERHDTPITRMLVDYLSFKDIVPNGVHIKKRPKQARTDSIEINQLLYDKERGAGVVNINTYSEDADWLEEITESIALFMDNAAIKRVFFERKRDPEFIKVSFKLYMSNLVYDYAEKI